MKHQKLVFVILASCTTSAVLANTGSSGFYVGTDTGASLFSNKQHVTWATVPNPMQYNTNESSTGAVAGLFAGYGYRYNAFYFAPELGINYSTAKVKNLKQDNLGVNYETSLTNNYSAEASLLAGVYTTPNTLFYGRAGFAYGHFSASSSQDAWTTGYTGSFHKWDPAFSVGAGIESMFTKCLGLRIEYDLTDFSRFSKQTPQAASAAAGKYAITTNYHPVKNQVLLGLTYHF